MEASTLSGAEVFIPFWRKLVSAAMEPLPLPIFAMVTP